MDLYREIILDHYRHPLNKGELSHADNTGNAKNVTCGDDLRLQLSFGEDGTVSDVAFEGQGCAISQASASLTTEAMKGKTLQEIKGMSKEDIFSFLGGPVNPGRINCALLILKARDEAIISKQ